MGFGLKFCRKLLRDEKGNMLMLATAFMPLLVGSAGFAIDVVHMHVVKRKLQRSADSAALAAGYAMTQERSAQVAVTEDLALGDAPPMSATPDVRTPPPTGTYANDGSAVRVQLYSQVNTPFIGFFSQPRSPVSATATARMFETGEYCLISLYEGTDPGISAGGNADLDLSCGMMTNSRGPNAVMAFGSSSVRATPVAAMGNIPASSNFVAGTKLIPNTAKQRDPLAHVPNPPPQFCSNNLDVQSKDEATISPGCYKSMDLKGTVKLNPGTYYINGGDVSFGAQSKVTGTGVTIVLTGTDGDAGSLDINGGADITLSAPGSGDYKGIAIYRDRRASVETVKFNGGGALNVQGALYMPTTDFDMMGNFDLKTQCMQLVGRIFTFRGTADLKNNCPAGSGSSAFSGTRVRLVR